MKVEQLQSILTNNVGAEIEGYVISVEQAERLLTAYNGLAKPENRDLFLKQNVFTLLSFLGKIGFTIVKPEAQKTT